MRDNKVSNYGEMSTFIPKILTRIGPGTSGTAVIQIEAPVVPGAPEEQEGAEEILWGNAWQKESSMRQRGHGAGNGIVAMLKLRRPMRQLLLSFFRS